jgi:uncharacterized protein involved in type VI secretion and phage assembly
MSQISATLTIENEDASDLFAALLEMEVEEDHRLATMFRIKLSIHRNDEGVWTFLDDERIRLWKKVVIATTSSGEETELVSGYITQLVPHLESDENQCSLEIHGLDTTCLMSLEEKIKDWPNKTDSDIAREIFQQGYNLIPEVEDIGVVHDEAVATIIQRETDIQFLKRLARRNGFECFVQGGAGFFRKPALDDEQQRVLSIHFGNETNLVSFDARLNALRPTAVEMHQYDTIGKEVIDAAAENGEQQQLGRDGALSIAPPDGLAQRLFIRHAVTTGQPEMENLCRAVFDEAEWLVEVRGEVDSVLYCAPLRARKPVPVRGAGELFSGIYYVTSVRHVFTPDRYAQHFTARRNALAPSGEEDFGDDDSLLGGVL